VLEVIPDMYQEEYLKIPMAMLKKKSCIKNNFENSWTFEDTN